MKSYIKIPLQALCAVLLFGLLAARIHAEGNKVMSMPTDQKGNQLHPLYSGAISSRTTVTGEILAVDGPAVLYGVYLTTGANTSYIVLKDTDSTNGVIALDKCHFAATQDLYASQNKCVPYPVRFNKGITVQTEAMPVGGSATVLYLLQQ